MVLNVIDNPFHYELQKLCGAFFPDEPVEVVEGADKEEVKTAEKLVVAQLKTNGSDTVDILITYRKGSLEIKDRATFPRFVENVDCLSVSLAENENSIELHTAQMVYKVVSASIGKKLSWGILTGIRPSKLLIRIMNDMGEQQGIEYFNKCFYVSPKKTELALEVSKSEEKIISKSTPDSFSLYVSIPFCPTRCSYCSFVSSAVNKESAKQTIPVYFDNLIKELKYTAEIANKCNIKMKSAYIGGGTPSTLEAQQIDILLKTINTEFDMSGCTEFTFEAGRPDTITQEKLLAVYENGVDRISINPQTMSDEILKAVGRMHTSEDVVTAFEKARNVGFKNINMDLIAGLPGDTFRGFFNSLIKITELNPESVTIHTLAYKRSSDLDYRGGLFNDGRETEKMVDLSYDLLKKNGYAPYYMYRQAKSVGNLENVGYAKPGFESAYNIFMMEECHSILACGAGAVSKLKNPHGTDISRIFNFKYPYEYNNRFCEQIERKKAVLDFYG